MLAIVGAAACGTERRPPLEDAEGEGVDGVADEGPVGEGIGEQVEGEGEGESDGEVEPVGQGEGEGEPVGQGEGEGEPVGQGEGEGEPVGQGEGEGEDPGPPPECLTQADCDDGVFCNGAEGCSEERCFASPRPPCLDRVDCTTDQCDEDNDQCFFEPDDGACAPDQICDSKAGCIRAGDCAVDENCDDGLLCNGQETCVEGLCQRGEPLECVDEVPCTVESCVEELGLCQSVPDHTLCLPTEFCNQDDGCIPRPPCDRNDECDDGFFCNGVEFCDGDVERCSAGGAPEVPDETPCTIDICSEGQALVLHVPNNARCSDAQFCNGAEVCHPADGCVQGVPPVLSDGVGCTVDTCDDALDFIEHTPDHEACQDALFCNGQEVCHPVDDCGLGEPVPTNDDVGCTIDSCSEVDDEVVHVVSDELCDDDQFCNGAETCDAELDCQAGDEPDLTDDLDCTDGRCNEADDRVEQDPVHVRCDNGLFCDGSELCAVGAGCIDGVDPDLSDGVDCTDDTCNEADDVAVHTPLNVRCDNGQFCDGQETCDAGQGCQDGPDPDVSDAHDCTDDTCDDNDDVAVHTPVHVRCLDAIICDGVERCDIQVGCVDSEQAADDGLACSANPRSLCNGGACELSECGDGLVDMALAEQCDDGARADGDGCDSDCQDEVAEPGDWDGTFDGDPNLSIFICGVFEIGISEWEMSSNGGQLTLVGSPGYPGALGGGLRPMDFTGAVPAGVDFTLEKRYEGAGLCTEVYSVEGAFDDADNWSGTFKARFLGALCGLAGCVALDRPVGGTRR